MKKYGALLVLLSFLFLNACSTEKPTEKIDKNVKISSIRVAYAYADNYAKRNLGDKYVLFKTDGRVGKDFNGEIQFMYKKRAKFSQDAHFVIVDTVNNEIKYDYLSNGCKQYEGNQYLNIENWKFNIETALTAASEAGVDYDEFRCFTDGADRIAVCFLKDGEKTDQFVYNTFTAERIT